jgi:signal transduction histidine kinase/CheY-like chemotaxis protein
LNAQLLPATSLKTIHVLVVEDHEDDFRYLSFLLGRGGTASYKLSWASSYAAGQTMLRTGGFDVALFDYRLGGGTGIDLLRDAKESGCEIPIILLTGHDSAEVDQEASQAGAADYLCKTGLNGTELERAIRYAMRQAAMTAALRQSQQQLELFMRSVPCAVCIRDEAGELLFQNELFSRFFRNEELPEAGDPGALADTWPYTRDGRHWLVNSFGMTSAQGRRLQGFAALDITERVRMEDELRNTTSLLNGILSSLPVVAARVASDGTLLESRGRGLETIGLRPGELTGRHVRELMAGQTAALESALRGGEANFRSEIARGRDTRYFDNYSRFDPAGGGGAILFAVDVTERVRAEAERNRQAQLLSSIMRSLPAVAGRIDAEGRIVEVQGAGLERLGLTPATLTGREFSAVFPAARAAITQALAGAPASFTVSGTCGDQEWYVEFFVTADAEHQAGTTFFGRDVTERRWLEQQLLTISDAEQQRIGADLHDGLGQQLTGMACLAAALRDRLKKTTAAEAENADLIARLASESVAQTRALARGLCPVQLEKASLGSALEDLTYQAQLLHGIECRCRTEGPLPDCDHLTATHLYRITQEAIHNAARHGQARHIWVTLAARGRQHALVIKDDGRGFKMDAVRAGAGAGLRLMSYRAAMIGGTFSAESHPERGTQITVLFTSAPAK